MSPLIVTWAARSAGKAAVGAARTPPSPLRRCAAPSLTTPPHLRFEEVVRERGRRGARRRLRMGQQKRGRGGTAGKAERLTNNEATKGGEAAVFVDSRSRWESRR